MFRRSWQEALRETLRHLWQPGRAPRVAVVGVGQVLCGDDAVGVYLTRMLRPLADGDERLLVVDAGSAPENFSGPLRRFQPDLVVLADAAQMDAEPGAVRWLDWQAAGGFSASTHTLPLRIFAAYLSAELDCRVVLLGIQPANITFGSPPTPIVQEAAETTAKALIEMIGAVAVLSDSVPTSKEPVL